jgi:hypothetical protein
MVEPRVIRIVCSHAKWRWPMPGGGIYSHCFKGIVKIPRLWAVSNGSGLRTFG